MNILKKNWMLIMILGLSVLFPAFYQILFTKNVNWLNLIVSLILGTIYAFGWKLFIDKKVAGIYLYIIGLGINIIVSYQSGAYGDAILRLFYMLPMQFIILKNWTKQIKNNNVILYHKWNVLEMVINLTLFILVVSFVSFNLKFISQIPVLNLIFKKGDPYIVLDACAVVGNIFAQYHLSKQHLGWFGANAIADGSLMMMWIAIYFNTNDANALVLGLSNFCYVIIVIYQYIVEKKTTDSITHEEFNIKPERI